MLYNGSHIVKTIRFNDMRTLGNPAQFAHVYNSRNVDELLFIDLTATRENRSPDLDAIREVMNECFMPVTIGGGIHSIADIHALLKIGADKVSMNSEAIKRPAFITEAAQKFGSQCIVVSIDAKKVGKQYRVYTDRGRTDAGYSVTDWARQAEQLGAGEILLTSIDQDGTMEGFDLALVKAVAAVVSLPVIACGGAGKVQDVVDAIKKGGADAVALASMFHYSGHTSNSIKERMRAAGIPVRILSV